MHSFAVNGHTFVLHILEVDNVVLILLPPVLLQQRLELLGRLDRILKLAEFKLRLQLSVGTAYNLSSIASTCVWISSGVISPVDTVEGDGGVLPPTRPTSPLGS